MIVGSSVQPPPAFEAHLKTVDSANLRNCSVCGHPSKISCRVPLLGCDLGHTACTQCSLSMKMCPICHRAFLLETAPNFALSALIESTPDVHNRQQITSQQFMTSNSASPCHSSTNISSKYIHLQQSLLVLISLHLLTLLSPSSSEDKHDEPPRSLRRLKQELATFFKKVAFVSHHFLESAVLAVHGFFRRTTFSAGSGDLPQLCSFASFFGADIQSVFVHVDGTFVVEEFVKYSSAITGLEVSLNHHHDLALLHQASLFFPHLKQLHVSVNSSISMSFIEVLNINAAVTSVNLAENSFGDEGATALAEMLKVNTTLASVNVFENSIEGEGARALAEMLKVNTILKSVNLGENSFGDEGVRLLADAFKINKTVTSVNLGGNSIGVDGIRALAEMLQVNSPLTNVNLGENSFGDEGVRLLADAFKVNKTVTNIDLAGGSFFQMETLLKLMVPGH
ncbi:hypothetical protein GEMRC1_014001 [Eukaryota sp. GEM-RC1]